MQPAHDYTDLISRLEAHGWSLEQIKENGQGFVAIGTDLNGDRGERIGDSPKMALANLIRFAERRNKMLKYHASTDVLQ